MIKFYKIKDSYGCFSNFSGHQIIIDNKVYKTSEHRYQSMKFATTDPAYAELIRNAPSPKEAAAFGRTVRTPAMREDWDEVKNNIMKEVLLKKFETHPGIRKILLDTGNEELCENSSTDSYWGCGSDGKGKNMLGVLLQEVREELRKKYETR